MKFISTLLAVLAIIGLGQTYKLQDFENDSHDEKNQSIMDLVFPFFGTISEESSHEEERTVDQEFVDFIKLIPVKESIEIVKAYFKADRMARNGMIFMFTIEFHDLLRKVEALKEHQALVVFIQDSGLNIIQHIKDLHKFIGMEDYVPPKVETENESEIGMQEVGEGMKGMYEDLGAILPTDKINSLYDDKIANSPVFLNFVKRVTSPECETLARNLSLQKAFRKMITKSAKAGLDFAAIMEYNRKVVPISPPTLIEV